VIWISNSCPHCYTPLRSHEVRKNAPFCRQFFIAWKLLQLFALSINTKLCTLKHLLKPVISIFPYYITRNNRRAEPWVQDLLAPAGPFSSDWWNSIPFESTGCSTAIFSPWNVLKGLILASIKSRKTKFFLQCQNIKTNAKDNNSANMHSEADYDMNISGPIILCRFNRETRLWTYPEPCAERESCGKEWRSPLRRVRGRRGNCWNVLGE
jgi:hypothetical protein